jgi:hypothetical protein
LPDAAAILDRYVEVTGGAEAYRKAHNRYFSGTFELAGMGIRGPVRTWQSPPANAYTEIDLQGIGLTRQGSNGEILWEVGLTGPRILEGTERAVMLRLSTFNAELLWRELYREAACVGKESVDGQSAWKVVLTPADGKPTTLFFAEETGLLVKQAMIVDTQMGEVPVETSVGDYRPVDGILIPHKSVQQAAGASQIILLDKVEHDIEMPAGRFEPPAEIRALLEKAAPAPAAVEGQS